MDWLLTDEEIKVICEAIMAQYGEGRDDEPTASSLVATFRAVAKAEAKKLVERLTGLMMRLRSEGFFHIDELVEDDEWQALKKDLGF